MSEINVPPFGIRIFLYFQLRKKERKQKIKKTKGDKYLRDISCLKGSYKLKSDKDVHDVSDDRSMSEGCWVNPWNIILRGILIGMRS